MEVSLLQPFQVYKFVGMSVALVGFVALLMHHFPVRIFGKEGIGLGWSVLDKGQRKPVGLVDGLAVDARPTYYIYMLVVSALNLLRSLGNQ